MELASIVNQYYDAFRIEYADIVLPGHLKALNAIRSCRTPASGELLCALHRLSSLRMAASFLWTP